MARRRLSNLPARWKRSEIQSLRFHKDDYTRRQAKAWAKAHGFKHGTVEEMRSYWAVPQFAQPRGFQARYFYLPGTDVEAIVAGRPARNPRRVTEPEFQTRRLEPDEIDAINVHIESYRSIPRRRRPQVAGVAIGDTVSLRGVDYTVVELHADTRYPKGAFLELIGGYGNWMWGVAIPRVTVTHAPNPRRVTDGEPGKARMGALGIVEMIGYVDTIKYQHTGDDQHYEHVFNFERPPILYALEGGGLLIEHTSEKLWADE